MQAYLNVQCFGDRCSGLGRLREGGTRIAKATRKDTNQQSTGAQRSSKQIQGEVS